LAGNLDGLKTGTTAVFYQLDSSLLEALNADRLSNELSKRSQSLSASAMLVAARVVSF
jgi:hypothetical protein